MENRENVLYVHTLGSFYLEWNGKRIVGGGRSSETQFSYLLQLLLHYKDQGVGRNLLEQTMFQDRDLDDMRHAMRTVLYNTRKKLKKMGLPGELFIEQKEGLYFWTDEVTIFEDSRYMESLYEAAKRETDPEKRLPILLEACYLYEGEFLSIQNTQIWAAQEARRYQSIFYRCVEDAVEILRDTSDYIKMEELGRFVTRVCPLANWETVTMESLIAMGRHDDARKLYNQTVELYYSEQGLNPSKEMRELIRRLGEQMEHGYAVLDDIQSKLLSDEPRRPGGYLVSYPVFQGIYEMVTRSMERGGQSVFLMLCTVVDSKGNPMKDGPILDELSTRLGDAICKSVRQSDTINRYGKGQYLVLLANTTRENCKVVQARINQAFILGRQRTGIEYCVNSVITTPEFEHI